MSWKKSTHFVRKVFPRQSLPTGKLRHFRALFGTFPQDSYQYHMLFWPISWWILGTFWYQDQLLLCTLILNWFDPISEMYVCIFGIFSFLASSCHLLTMPASDKPPLWSQASTWFMISNTPIQYQPPIQYNAEWTMYEVHILFICVSTIQICLCISVDLIQYVVLCHILCAPSAILSSSYYYVQWPFNNVLFHITFPDICFKIAILKVTFLAVPTGSAL